jgi:two-component system response regulator PilR (NtrC family)
MLGREKYDLVIVDQGSSNFEGRSVLSRAVEVDRRVPVLVLTRTVDADCCIEALDSGALEYVQKPLTTTEVRELVSDYVKIPPIQFADRAGYAFQKDSKSADGGRVERASLRKAS